MMLGSSSMMMGDIWSTGAFSFESPLKDLLDTENYTLEQLLAEDELLQELRGVHPVLLEFFSSTRVVSDLVKHAVLAAAPEEEEQEHEMEAPSAGGQPDGVDIDAATSPAAPSLSNRVTSKKPAMGTPAANASHSLSDPEFRLIRLPYMACEVICCELSCVIDTIVDGYDDEGEGGESDSNAPRQHQILDGDPDSVEVVDHENHNASGGGPPRPLSKDEATATATASESAATAEVVLLSPSHAPPPSGRRRILDVLFSLVQTSDVLDDYRAGYFEKILRVLFRWRSEDMVRYVNENAGTLLPAMLRHLYSHSILQVVQRLLLPHRPSNAGEGNDSGSPDGGGPGLDEVRLMAGVADDGDIPVGLLEGIEDDNQITSEETGGGEISGILADDPTAGEIKSDWSRRPEALELLLDMLLHGREIDNGNDQGEMGKGDDLNNNSDRQRHLDMSLNAAEVLITMVQNSLMSSTVMLTLTSSHILGRLVVAASTLPTPDATFSPHESTTTAAMSVLESLILQLGGYGAIGTMSMLDDVMMMELAELNEQAQPAHVDGGYADPFPPAPPTAPTTTSSPGRDDDPHHPSSSAASSASPSPDLVRIADLASLLEHLPLLLDNLSALLRHPDCENWKSPTQFSKEVPVQQLGSARLRIVRVLESLVLLGDPEVDARLVQSDCLEVCLNLFWDFQWCSMLHQSVANLLVHVLEGQNLRVEMQEYFLIRCNLLVRLMDSFVDPASSSSTTATANALSLSGGTSAPPVRDRLSISEDDVDAAMEKQQETDAELGGGASAASAESVTASEADPAAGALMVPPPQSFRYGYMGHVIIICQALVHACKEADESGAAAGDSGGGDGGGEASTAASSSVQQQQQPQPPRQVDSGEGADQLPGLGGASALGHMIASGATKKQQLEVFSRSGGDESTAVSKEPLYLAEMVVCHPLSHKWKEFVATTLAAETTIQSTPLGGFDAAAILEGMQMQRPGLADDGDDMGLEPPSRMGDVLDMDDNDLEIAASMMAGLSVSARAHSLDDDDEASGDSNRSYNSGETNNSGGGYLFDDPLGRLNGGLGIELGKLTKYNPDTDDPDAVLKDEGEVGNDDDGDNGSTGSPNSYHSSDDEQDRRESEKDVPVLDLFAGNFDFGSSQEQHGTGDGAGQDWSDFANFDDAFANVGGTPVLHPPETAGEVQAISDVSDGAAVGGEPGLGDSSSQHSSSDLDDLFGPGDHASLLVLEDPKADASDLASLPVVIPSKSVDVMSGELPRSPVEHDPAQEDAEIMAAPSDELKADLSEQVRSTPVVVEPTSEGT